ncbi:metallophosphoesterase [Christensenellaceae bacterium OttesenSCG-928-K19]|nr:metallophosphoesterase [Christensenellaceae bacterium OttesenSCG-928-K19]
MFNNNTIEITSYGLLSRKIENGFTIAHLSDLHEKEFGHHNHRLFAKVQELNPDIIAVTGDLVAHESQKKPNTTYTYELAKGLSAIAPAFFVTGNHEKQFDSEITGALADGGVTVIRGGVYTVDVRGARINITGLDDISYNPSSAGLGQVLNSMQGLDGFNLFLTHRPELFNDARYRNIDLILAGHTHAGQIRIPAISKIYMNGQGFFPKYMQGEFTDGETTMIISRGLGASGYPTFRINNPPDLVAVYVQPLEVM